MAVRFPAANDLGEFWDNLLTARDCIGSLTEEQILRAGEDPHRLAMPGYVRRRPRIDGPYDFDAGFFGVTPREAEVRDPQFRVFLEVSHAALEHAGQVPADFPGRIGIFAGAGRNNYASDHVEPNAHLLRSVGQLAVDFNNDPDYFAASVAHRLGLTGPSLTVRTACSTSLVALHLARQALLAGDCELAVVGGAMIDPASERGFVHVPGGVNSQDGSCRPFDSAATGTNFGDGVGAVVVKRLSDALADGDTVYAVVRGSMVNNDGGRSTGFTAPSVDGQADCITGAFTAAGLDPRTISYFEAHGTGTGIGDRIEVAAMTRAFRAIAGEQLPPGSCLLGSVKSNLGHLGAAAGIAGVIKTVLALWHERLPASINVNTVNPELGLDSSPFEVITESRPWPRQPNSPRRACVNSFGIGGTNAHVILEEPTQASQPPTGSGENREQIIVWSADDANAATELRERLRSYFADAQNLADAAFTLQVGRTARAVRSAVVVRDRAQLDSGVISAQAVQDAVFHFPGESSWRPGLARELHDIEPDFRDACDSAFGMVEPLAGQPLRALWLSSADVSPELARPILFVIQYALATCLIRSGVRPVLSAGAGVGELAAQAVADGGVSRELAESAVSSPQRTIGAEGALIVHIGPITLPIHSETTFNEALATLWVHGQEIDWQRRAPQTVKRVAVPGYPYQRKRYWVEYHGRTGQLPAGWNLLHEQWRIADEAPATPRSARALVLQPDNAEWVSDAVREAGYRICDDDLPDLIVHALGVTPDAEVDLSTVDAHLEAGLYSILTCVQGLKVHNRQTPVTLAILSRFSVDLTGAEPLNPTRAMLNAFARTIEREIPGIRCVLIDVGPVTVNAVLAAELASLSADRVALRGRTRWLPEIAPVSSAPVEPGPLRERGIYLITGGLGGVGLVIAQALADTGLRPRLVLLGRSGTGDIGRLEAAGATVAVIAADVSDPESLRAARAEIERRFGRGPHGVVHAAGVAGGGLVERRTRSEVDSVLRAKVHGALALDEVFSDLDFLVHFSSQAGITGLRGSSDYAAANAFLNAHAQQRRVQHPRSLSIAWPAWERTGMTDPGGYRVVIAPGRTWQLDEHKFGAVPVLPATAMLEFVVAAARELGTAPVGVRDMLILAPLSAEEPRVVEVNTTGSRFRLRSRPEHGGSWTDHAEGLIETTETEPSERLDGPPLAATHDEVSTATGPGFGFGPRWNTEVRAWRDDHEAVVELALPQRFHADLRDHVLHPALLDVATSSLIETTAESVFVPFRYREVAVFGRLTDRVTARSWLRESTESTRVVDVDIHDTATGRHLVAIRSLTFRSVSRKDFSSIETPSRSSHDPQLSPVDGARIFLDALRQNLPATVIVEHSGSQPEPALLSSEEVAPPSEQPVTEVVRQLWTDLLGNPDIGLDDDFFDVGGSSLAAVHIVDQIEQRYGIALSSGALFESATVRTISDTLTQRGAR